MPKGYSSAQIGLHWIIALLIALQFLFNEHLARFFVRVIGADAHRLVLRFRRLIGAAYRRRQDLFDQPVHEPQELDALVCFLTSSSVNRPNTVSASNL